MDWLLAPIDPSRAHEVGLAVSWHGRMMVLAWGLMAPTFLVIARFFKVWPGQDWPRELDSQIWWRIHWIGQTLVVVLTLAAVGLIISVATASHLGWHGRLGYLIVALALLQVAGGALRGSKGGPTAPCPAGTERGDHYDMTELRRRFETLHKANGYVVIVLASATILLGMWKSNAPNWMWMSLGLWWTGLIVVFVILQSKGRALDTYQAIWGPDPSHPGNQGKHPGWGMRRANEKTETTQDVRSDRGHRVRGDRA